MSDLLTVTVDNFEADVLKSKTPVLIDFWAEWCGPCKAFAPTFEAVSADYKGKVVFAKLNTDEQKPLMERYGVRGIPTMILVNNGEEVARFSGGRPRRVFKQWIDENIGEAVAAHADHIAVAIPDRAHLLPEQQRTDNFLDRLAGLTKDQWQSIVDRTFSARESNRTNSDPGVNQEQLEALQKECEGRPAKLAQLARALTMRPLLGDVTIEVMLAPLCDQVRFKDLPESESGRFGANTSQVEYLLSKVSDVPDDEEENKKLHERIAAVSRSGEEGDYQMYPSSSALSAVKYLETLSDHAVQHLYGPFEAIIPLASVASSAVAV